MQGDLYSPSLQDHAVTKTKSYNISGLFLVAFFGGIIGVTVLGIRNAQWLRLEKKLIQLLVAISVILFICKTFVVYAISTGMLNIADSNVDNIVKAFGVLCFIFYYFMLKKPFKEHLAVGGDTEVLYKQGILWVLISVVIEVILIQMMA